MTTVFAFVAGAVVMGIVWWLRRGVERTNWVLRGQEQAELAHGWHRPVDGVPIPTPRRSPNEQFVFRVAAQMRPGFDPPSGSMKPDATVPPPPDRR